MSDQINESINEQAVALLSDSSKKTEDYNSLK